MSVALDVATGPDFREISAYLKATEGDRRVVAYATLLGLSPETVHDLHQMLDRGFPVRALDRLQVLLDASLLDIAEWLRIPVRTLQRRRAQPRLLPEESDRLARLARLFGLALELFEGDRAATLAWLRRPAAALGQLTPLALSTSDAGAREVERLIGRLEHGIVS